ncbi:MAG: hypothetical protein ACI85O_003159 [Saprospiraceae bacterium]|jgi:hypothetical protein
MLDYICPITLSLKLKGETFSTHGLMDFFSSDGRAGHSKVAYIAQNYQKKGRYATAQRPRMFSAFLKVSIQSERKRV